MGSHDRSVHHQPFVRVDTDTEKTRIGVDLQDLVARPQVIEDASPEKNETIMPVIKLNDEYCMGKI